MKRPIKGLLVSGLLLGMVACGGSGDKAPEATATSGAVATATPDVYATATAWTAATPPAVATANAMPNAIPNTAAGKQLAWVLQFLFAIDPTQLDPQDITPRFTEEFLTALPVDRLTSTVKTFTEQHGQVSFDGFVSPPADTELAAYLRSSTGERFIIRLKVETSAPYRIASFQVAPAR